jgi:ADP-ribosylglycohydrolase
LNYHGRVKQPPVIEPRLAQSRPVKASYWVVPGRLLVGEHPGSRSRADSMERLRRFLEAGITCFIDLTVEDETPAYEMLLPFETPTGRRVEYLREPIADHGTPADRETMARILAVIDGALDAGHNVYLHCRAGIGRSSMAAGCWLAERNAGGGAAALEELADLWQQSSRAALWPCVPETDEQTEYVQTWTPLRLGLIRPPSADGRHGAAGPTGPAAGISLEERVRGAWLGLALGDALGAAPVSAPAAPSEPGASLVWTQHTALTLGLAGSLLTVGRADERDQIERYWRWFKDGELAASGEPGEAAASADVARALATYRWRGLPRAGSHDPQDASATSLPRVLAAVLYAGADPAVAIALAAAGSRTTHQSPLILDACRLYAAMLLCALRGQPDRDWLEGVPQPAPRCWGSRPLRKDVRAAATDDAAAAARSGTGNDVLQVLSLARRIVREAADFDSAIEQGRRGVRGDAALLTALVGTMYGMRHGLRALPAVTLGRLAARDRLEAVASQCLSRLVAMGAGA